MYQLFPQRPLSLAQSQQVIDQARREAANEVCAATDSELDGHYMNAAISSGQISRLTRLAKLLEDRCRGVELTRHERAEVRSGVRLLRGKLGL